jgi:hypothetical protein
MRGACREQMRWIGRQPQLLHIAERERAWATPVRDRLRERARDLPDVAGVPTPREQDDRRRPVTMTFNADRATATDIDRSSELPAPVTVRGSDPAVAVVAPPVDHRRDPFAV